MAIEPGTVSDLYQTSVNAEAVLLNQLVNECTLRWDDLTFASTGITVNPIGAVANPLRDETETDFPGTLLFSGTQVNVLAGLCQVKHCWKEGTALRPHIHWTKPAGGAGDNVSWTFYYRILKRGIAPGAWQGPVAGTLAVDHNGTAEAEAITSFGEIDLTGMPVSTNVAWRLYRLGNADAFNGTARLLELDFHYQIDSRGSPQEYSK